ncbi:hypothetical protein AB0H36_14605 [Kribbella sp. NPDC050820]|uniref:hypothetical protein n=1 Tax=Kribbella sp. NPDC050820 TaxID=3155408 RepID=UPI0033E67099
MTGILFVTDPLAGLHAQPLDGEPAGRPVRRSPDMSTVTIVCMALMGILLFLLGANVTRHRAIRGGGNQAPTDLA